MPKIIVCGDLTFEKGDFIIELMPFFQCGGKPNHNIFIRLNVIIYKFKLFKVWKFTRWGSIWFNFNLMSVLKRMYFNCKFNFFAPLK